MNYQYIILRLDKVGRKEVKKILGPALI